jgi:hypothetical protein
VGNKRAYRLATPRPAGYALSRAETDEWSGEAPPAHLQSTGRPTQPTSGPHDRAHGSCAGLARPRQFLARPGCLVSIHSSGAPHRRSAGGRRGPRRPPVARPR